MHKLQLGRLNGSNSDCPACTHLLEAELLSDPFPKYREELDSEHADFNA